jgi:ethanolamine utilization protein EutA
MLRLRPAHRSLYNESGRGVLLKIGTCKPQSTQIACLNNIEFEATSHLTVTLFGLDVGSTTTSLLVASGRFVRNCVTGRNELGEVSPIWQPEPAFTPFRGDLVDIPALERQVDTWLADGQIDPISITSGGALITGLAARTANSQAITIFVRRRFHDAVVAAADDPCLESWLAFMGNALELSRAEPKRPFINLDIGGGTTNLAWGLAGEVKTCGCYYVGARHVQVEPGTYRLRALSSFARHLFQEFRVAAEIGDELPPDDLARLLEFYVDILERAVTDRQVASSSDCARLHCQVVFRPPDRSTPTTAEDEPIITVSGGVGELAYRMARGESVPGTTAFGDLGIDLARRICRSPILSRNLASHIPSGLGRATVHGLTKHSTEISGATLFLPHPDVLPLTDLPILGQFSPESSDRELADLLDLAQRSATGACLRLEFEDVRAATLKTLGERLASLLGRISFPNGRPLVLLTPGNIGKTLGNYATRWGKLASYLIVIDEVPRRAAHFATIGRLRDGLVPVAFHGLDARIDRSSI